MSRFGLRISLLLLFFFSGSAALGYQIVWSRMFATGLGHEFPAVLAIVCAFMGGMAIGAWVLNPVVSRSQKPGRCYGLLEIIIGVWAICSGPLIPFINQSTPHLIGLGPSPLRHWALALLLPFIALLPATAAMGATLPAMERFLSPFAAERRCIGALYAANTLGAVVGILVSTFVILPALGFEKTAWLLGAINIVCGVTALVLAKETDGAGAVVQSPHSSLRSKHDSNHSVSSIRLGATLCVTGLLGIGYESVGVRVLSQVLENTIYTFAAVLSVYLLGTALGAALYQRFGGHARSGLLLTNLLGSLSLSCMFGVLAAMYSQTIYDACRAALGDGKAAVLLAEMFVAGSVFGLPTVFMGATFSHLVQAAQRKEGGVGRAFALNTFGGALAGVLFSVALVPRIGLKWTLVSISLGYLPLLPTIMGWRWGFLLAPLVLMLALPSNLRLVQVPVPGKLLEHRDGVMASVSVVEDATANRTLRVDNRFQMGGTGAAEAEYRQAHIPLLLHPSPKRALFLGLGTGITCGAASLYPDLIADGVELVPEVVEVLHHFEPYNFSPLRNARLKIHVADARRFVRTTKASYDVVVSDLFHPARDGAGALYTVEHFQAIGQRLAPGGLFCQWLPLHQLDEGMLQIITRTFLQVFPKAQAYLLRFNVDAPVVGLVGSFEPRRYSDQWVEQRLGAPELEAHLRKLPLADSLRLFGNLIAGPEELRAFAGQAPLNTDDQPRIIFGAPEFVYQKHATSYGRLLTLLRYQTVKPAEVLTLKPDADRFVSRLTSYIRARDLYLKGLVDDLEGRSTQAIDAFVESARLSEDFSSGYAQCLTLASLQAKTRPDEARKLLQRLVEAQPSRTIAREMLLRLFGE
jgi:spermidine synthase